jgi:hypothetical protein
MRWHGGRRRLDGVLRLEMCVGIRRLLSLIFVVSVVGYFIGRMSVLGFVCGGDGLGLGI